MTRYDARRAEDAGPDWSKWEASREVIEASRPRPWLPDIMLWIWATIVGALLAVVMVQWPS